MDYVQHPYFTDENVEKEKGIIGQEIMMYDDYPEWKVYLNTLEAMYYSNPVKLDITGTIDTIKEINKEILYKCYNTFYQPSNMAMVVCGDFEPEKLLEEIKKRLIKTDKKGEIKRIYPEEPENIVKEKVIQKMDVSRPLFNIGIKVNNFSSISSKEKVRKSIMIQLILNLLFGESSNLYKKLYNNGNISYIPVMDFEYSKTYSHILISGQSNNPEELYEELKKEIKNMKNQNIKPEDFERLKKTLYGEYIKEYNDVTDIARMFLVDYFKDVNTFEFVEQVSNINLEEIYQILDDYFDESKMVLSIVQA